MLDLWKVFDGAAMVFGIIDGAVLLAFKWTHNKILNVWTIDQTDMLRFEECLCLDEWMIWLVLWVWGSRLAVLRITLSTYFLNPTVSTALLMSYVEYIRYSRRGAEISFFPQPLLLARYIIPFLTGLYLLRETTF